MSGATVTFSRKLFWWDYHSHIAALLLNAERPHKRQRRNTLAHNMPIISHPAFIRGRESPITNCASFSCFTCPGTFAHNLNLEHSDQVRLQGNWENGAVYTTAVRRQRSFWGKRLAPIYSAVMPSRSWALSRTVGQRWIVFHFFSVKFVASLLTLVRFPARVEVCSILSIAPIKNLNFVCLSTAL